MKRCYIGVGGIGGRLLREYEKTRNDGDRFIYIDSDPFSFDGGESYVLTRQHNGCALRIIGKDEIKAQIYNGSMPDFVDDFFLSEELAVTFVTTTFGNFGSAVIYELSDYYGVKIRDHRQNNDVSGDFSCRMIAFPLQDFDYLKGAPEDMLAHMGTNEIECLNELRDKEARSDKWYQASSNCMPFVELFVPASSDTEHLYEIIGMPDDELRKIDIKKSFHFAEKPKKSLPEVFISYSSHDQSVADMLVETAKDRGVRCWIASSSIEAGSYAKQIVQGIRAARVFVVIVSESAMLSPHVKSEIEIATGRIRDGLIIMPFKIDEAELDDDCIYYLARHEIFMGEKPPMEERVAQFVEQVKKVLE